MADQLPATLRTLLTACAESLEQTDHYLGFGSTADRRHAAAARELALRVRAELDAAALRSQLIAR